MVRMQVQKEQVATHVPTSVCDCPTEKAPEERHVYSPESTHEPQAPEERHESLDHALVREQRGMSPRWGLEIS